MNTSLMHTWHWQTWQGMPYLTCTLLDRWPHGFFTQQCWPRPPAELVSALHPQAAVYRVKQVHGNTVLSASEIAQLAVASQSQVAEVADNDGSLSFSEADGLFTEQSEQAVWVCTADCTPVLIADVVTGQVAAVHAGWRGTAAAIVPQTIDRLQSQGSRLADLRVAMGPAIAGEVYQVAETVAAQVGTTIAPAPTNSVEELLATLRQLPQPPVLEDSKPGHARLDVRQVNRLQLEQLGLQPEQLAIAPYCTYQTPDHFFSYRRDRQKKVQWSGIVSV